MAREWRAGEELRRSWQRTAFEVLEGETVGGREGGGGSLNHVAYLEKIPLELDVLNEVGNVPANRAC